MRSNSGDLTVQAFQCSPFRDGGYGNPLLSPDSSSDFYGYSLPSSLMDTDTTFSLARYMNERSPRRSEIDLPSSDHVSQSNLSESSDSGDYFDRSHVIHAISGLADLGNEDFEQVAADRVWEQVPIQDINTLHPVYTEMFTPVDISQLDLGPYHALLSFYIHQAVSTNEHYKDGCMSHLSRYACTRDLIRFATTLGLVPLVVKLHLEYTNRLEIPMERIAYLLYQRGKHNRQNSSSPRRSRTSSDDHTHYYPGIELKLGKERDTIIRPLLTSIFRSNREAFKAALLDAGLRYGELRMWKDAQLCTAIHVADTFQPGVWDKAVALHIKKTSKRKLR